MSASDLKYPDNFFDICFGHGALHHTIKYPNIGSELARVMKPGGKAVFCENLGHNKLFAIFRNLIKAMNKSHDVEYLLKYEDYDNVGKYFKEINIYEMALFFLAKRFFGVRIKNRSICFLLNGLKIVDDLVLDKFTFMKRYCGEAVVEYIK